MNNKGHSFHLDHFRAILTGGLKPNIIKDAPFTCFWSWGQTNIITKDVPFVLSLRKLQVF